MYTGLYRDVSCMYACVLEYNQVHMEEAKATLLTEVTYFYIRGAGSSSQLRGNNNLSDTFVWRRTTFLWSVSKNWGALVPSPM